ncbi:MAG: hypothetical protein MUF48_21235 [Pirellulaceae bacterium]|nr:hypothetical protein [Pirellulaceae bacterium]
MRKRCFDRLVYMVLCGTLLATGMPGMASQAPPAPDWVKQIAPGTWAAVSLNTIADVDPARDPELNPRHPGLAPWSGVGQYAVLDAWNGGAFAAGYGRSGGLIICGGGHTDYYGNEVYAFDLDSRRWNRLTNPYPTPVFPVADGIWPDGTPSVSHTFEQVDYHPGTNSFVMMKTQYHNTGGKSSPVVAMFSLDNLAPPDSNANRDLNKRNWRFSPVHTDNYTNSGGWSAYDSKRDLFWAHGGDGSRAMVSFDPKPDRGNGRFGSFQSYPIRTGLVDLAAAYDPINDIVAVTVFRNSSDILAVDLARPADGRSGNVKLVQTGSPPTLEESHGWEWSPSRRAFVYYRRGAGVYEFKQEGRNWRTDPWRWTGLTSQDNTVVPVDARSTGTQGPFGRFRIVRFDDSEIALVVTRVDGPVYAFKIPPSPVPRPRQPQDLAAR